LVLPPVECRFESADLVPLDDAPAGARLHRPIWMNRGVRAGAVAFMLPGRVGIAPDR